MPLQLFPEYDDITLFRMTAEGDEMAFTELFHRYNPKLLPFVFKLTRQESIAREIIQETFLRLWVDRHKLPAVDQPASWIFRIASNVSINWLRQQGRRRQLLQLAEADTANAAPAHETVESRELSLIIHRAVDALPDKRQQIYRLSREQGLTHQQIANELGISPNTVKNQIGIALQFIQTFINRETGLSLATLIVLFGK
jgi:RNA polymerase sigma-70 factor (family 1)